MPNLAGYSPGDTVTFTAPSGGVVNGSVYQIGNIIGVSATTADEGEEFELITRGVFLLPKATGTAWTEGLLLHWDDGDSEFNTSALGNFPAGCAAAAAASAAAVGLVRLNGIAAADGA
jgi:predicted RecA/RadA family phage recombinase